MPPKLKFQEGEKVLCYHGPLLYEAKCLKAEIKDRTAKFYIHYNGWKKSWDEWVPESRVLKYNEAGLQKQKELRKSNSVKVKEMKMRGGRKSEKDKDAEKGEGDDGDDAGDEEESEENSDKSADSTPAAPEKINTERKRPAAAAATAAAAAQSSTTPTAMGDSSTPQEQSRRKRQRVEPIVEAEESFVAKLEVKIQIPEALKPWLVDDWDLITRQKQLIHLPCRTTVDNILDDYVKYRLAKDASNAVREEVKEVTKGLREYFNVMLGSQLLYKFERLQYAEILTEYPDTPKYQIYGAMHLLRLFVRLGSHLAYTQLDEAATTLLVTHLQSFLKYLSQHSATLFSVNDYMITPPEYHRKAL